MRDGPDARRSGNGRVLDQVSVQFAAVDDEALLARCRRGEQRAWNQLVERYERLVYSIPLNLGLTTDDAADVTQATFSALLRSIESIDAPDRIGAWLSTVAKRQAIRVIERRDRDRAAPDDQPIPTDDDGAHRLAADIEWLHQGLTMISPRCRKILTELYFATTTYESAAANLGMPLGSLGPTRSRCLDSLRAALAKLYDADG